MKHPFLIISLFIVLASCADQPTKNQKYQQWAHYLGDPERTHYSTLDQINKENVSQLEVAWEYHSGDASPNTVLQHNPIIIDNVLYGVSPVLKVFALNAATGEELWANMPVEKGRINRGLLYWEDGEDKRIFAGIDKYVVAFNAKDGTVITSFGKEGKLDLKEGLGRDVTTVSLGVTTPGVIYKDLMIQGFLTSESLPAVPGHIRAYDVRTGEQKWIFHTIPQPGEYGYDTWPENAWMYSGGVNNWAGMALDEDRGIVFVPTGSASDDFWGGDRKGENLFANTLLALNAETGERIWHFQTVHHDIWDRDLPAPPTLITVTHNGRKIDAVAQITKTGFVFLFDRETGEPLFPIEERPYPVSDLFGEEAWATQPVPVKPPPFARQSLTANDINPFSKDHDSLKTLFGQLVHKTLYDPLTKQGTIIYPGTGGGGEWGGAGWDPTTGLLYVNSNDIAVVMTMVDIREGSAKTRYDQGSTVYKTYCMGCHGADMRGSTHFGNALPLLNVTNRITQDSVLQIMAQGRNQMPSFNFLTDAERQAVLAFLWKDTLSAPLEGEATRIANPYRHTGYNRFNDSEGYHGHTPPWGTLNAIDMNSGEIRWQVPLGEYEELTEKGIPPTGMHNYGGMVVTAGGLVFIGATPDDYFRAFDKDTGEELWRYKLPFTAMSSPSTYEVDGVQYVVVPAGGGKLTKERGDLYIAFKLK